MCAARLLPSTFKLRYTSLAILGGSGILAFSTGRKRVHYDKPSGHYWPEDSTFVITPKAPVAGGSRPKSAPQVLENKSASTTSNESAIDGPSFEDDDDSAWAIFSRNISYIKQDVTSIDWLGLGDRLSDFLLPAWARQIPDQIQKIQFELSMEPGTLADDIWQEAQDPEINPEITLAVTVRVGNELCREEKAFRGRRKDHVVKALAKYLSISEEEIDLEDMPTIAFCGSGGGLRALVAGAASYLSAQDAGLFDCVTYTAGVSGSCWLQALYYSSLGRQNYTHLIDHLKNRIGTHIAFPPDAMKLMTTAPTNKFLLSGFVEKLKGDPGANFGLVDIYGLLLATRLLVPKGDLDVSDSDLKLSNQRRYIDNGSHPLPVYTAVRHEIPYDKVAAEAIDDDTSIKDTVEEKAKKEAWFQWFEFTPYETFCEEFGAGIPSYALGRSFKNGRNEVLETGVALPEIRIPLLMGIWGSAFCATLSHYYKEIRPVAKGVFGFGGLDTLLEEKNEDLIKIHPIEPATVPNFLYAMRDQLPLTCPASIVEQDHLQLMDAGMSNNLPIAPLLRPGRNVDILVAFDASADIKRENWLSVADEYAHERGIRGWPSGAGWPKPSSQPDEASLALNEAHTSSPQGAAMKVAATREQHRQEDSTTGEMTEAGKHRDAASADLGYCNIWVGSFEARDTDVGPRPWSKRLSATDLKDAEKHLMTPHAGLALIYFPFLPNPEFQGVDPDKTDFMSTWNFIYTPEEVDKVVALARANFEAGREQTKNAIRAVYERKKTLRQQREHRLRVKLWKRKLREGGDHFA